MLLPLVSLLALLFAIATPAVAFDEPDGLRGVPWGSSIEEAKARLAPEGRLTCPGGNHCVMSARIGGVAADFAYQFRNDRLVAGAMSFPATDYDSVRRAFLDRYGPPTRTAAETLTTGKGERFTNEILRWEGEKSCVSLRRHAPKDVNRGRAELMPREEWDQRPEATFERVRSEVQRNR